MKKKYFDDVSRRLLLLILLVGGFVTNVMADNVQTRIFVFKDVPGNSAPAIVYGDYTNVYTQFVMGNNYWKFYEGKSIERTAITTFLDNIKGMPYATAVSSLGIGSTMGNTPIGFGVRAILDSNRERDVTQDRFEEETIIQAKCLVSYNETNYYYYLTLDKNDNVSACGQFEGTDTWLDMAVVEPLAKEIDITLPGKSELAFHEATDPAVVKAKITELLEKELGNLLVGSDLLYTLGNVVLREVDGDGTNPSEFDADKDYFYAFKLSPDAKDKVTLTFVSSDGDVVLDIADTRASDGWVRVRNSLNIVDQPLLAVNLPGRDIFTYMVGHPDATAESISAKALALIEKSLKEGIAAFNTDYADYPAGQVEIVEGEIVIDNVRVRRNGNVTDALVDPGNYHYAFDIETGGKDILIYFVGDYADLYKLDGGDLYSHKILPTITENTSLRAQNGIVMREAGEIKYPLPHEGYTLLDFYVNAAQSQTSEAMSTNIYNRLINGSNNGPLIASEDIEISDVTLPEGTVFPLVTGLYSYSFTVTAKTNVVLSAGSAYPLLDPQGPVSLNIGETQIFTVRDGLRISPLPLTADADARIDFPVSIKGFPMKVNAGTSFTIELLNNEEDPFDRELTAENEEAAAGGSGFNKATQTISINLYNIPGIGDESYNFENGLLKAYFIPVEIVESIKNNTGDITQADLEVIMTMEDFIEKLDIIKYEPDENGRFFIADAANNNYYILLTIPNDVVLLEGFHHSISAGSFETIAKVIPALSDVQLISGHRQLRVVTNTLERTQLFAYLNGMTYGVMPEDIAVDDAKAMIKEHIEGSNETQFDFIDQVFIYSDEAFLNEVTEGLLLKGQLYSYAITLKKGFDPLNVAITHIEFEYDDDDILLSFTIDPQLVSFYPEVGSPAVLPFRIVVDDIQNSEAVQSLIDMIKSGGNTAELIVSVIYAIGSGDISLHWGMRNSIATGVNTANIDVLLPMYLFEQGQTAGDYAEIIRQDIVENRMELNAGSTMTVIPEDILEAITIRIVKNQAVGAGSVDYIDDDTMLEVDDKYGYEFSTHKWYEGAAFTFSIENNDSQHLVVSEDGKSAMVRQSLTIVDLAAPITDITFDPAEITGTWTLLTSHFVYGLSDGMGDATYGWDQLDFVYGDVDLESAKISEATWNELFVSGRLKWVLYDTKREQYTDGNAQLSEALDPYNDPTLDGEFKLSFVEVLGTNSDELTVPVPASLRAWLGKDLATLTVIPAKPTFGVGNKIIVGLERFYGEKLTVEHIVFDFSGNFVVGGIDFEPAIREILEENKTLEWIHSSEALDPSTNAGRHIAISSIEGDEIAAIFDGEYSITDETFYNIGFLDIKKALLTIEAKSYDLAWGATPPAKEELEIIYGKLQNGEEINKSSESGPNDVFVDDIFPDVVLHESAYLDGATGEFSIRFTNAEEVQANAPNYEITFKPGKLTYGLIGRVINWEWAGKTIEIPSNRTFSLSATVVHASTTEASPWNDITYSLEGDNTNSPSNRVLLVMDGNDYHLQGSSPSEDTEVIKLVVTAPGNDKYAAAEPVFAYVKVLPPAANASFPNIIIGGLVAEYDGAARAVTVSVSDLNSGEKLETYDVYYAEADASEEEKVFTKTPPVNVGEYDVKVTGLVQDTKFTVYAGSRMKILPKFIDVTVENQTIKYGDGEPTFDFVYDANAMEDFYYPANKPLLAKVDGDYENAGTYAVTPYSEYVMPTENLKFNYISGTLTVEKAALKITADDKSSAYGATMATLTYEFDGLVNDDKEANLGFDVRIQTDATRTSPVGTYAITFSGTPTVPNYDVTFVGAKYSVLKAEQEIAWTPETTTLEKNSKIELNAVASSKLAVTFESANTELAEVVLEGGKYYLLGTGVGTVSVTASQVGDDNYLLANPVTVQFTVETPVGSVGIEDGAINVYPTLFTNTINVTAGAIVKRVEVITYTGAIVKAIDYPAATIDLSSLTAGNYTLRVVLEDGATQTVKIVKK